MVTRDIGNSGTWGLWAGGGREGLDGRGGQPLEVSGSKGGLLPQDVLVGCSEVLLGGQHLRGELTGAHAGGAGEGLTASTSNIAQDGEVGETDGRGPGRGKAVDGLGSRGRSRSRSSSGLSGWDKCGSEGLLAAQEGADLTVNIELAWAGTGSRGRSRGRTGDWSRG